jgi:hypothetical protein
MLKVTVFPDGMADTRRAPAGSAPAEPGSSVIRPLRAELSPGFTGLADVDDASAVDTDDATRKESERPPQSPASNITAAIGTTIEAEILPFRPGSIRYGMAIEQEKPVGLPS